MDKNKQKLIVAFKDELWTKDKILKFIANSLSEKFNKVNKEELYEKLLKREQQITTGIGEGIALPHAAIENLEKPVLFFIKLRNEMDWDAIDEKPINLIFCILTPVNDQVTHLEIISSISSILMSFEKKQKILAAKNIKEIEEVLYEKVFFKKNKNYSNKIDIVAITACPSGLAHTFLAKSALENEAAKHNKTIKVETRGANGTENSLTDSEINEAELLIIAVDKDIDLTRYQNKNTKYFRTIDIVKKPEIIFENKETAFFKKEYQKIYSSLIFSVTKFFGFTKIIGFVLGILYILNFYFQISSLVIEDIRKIIQLLSTLVICCFVGFLSHKLTGRDEIFLYSFFLTIFSNQNILLGKSLQIGLIFSILIGILWCFYINCIYKYILVSKFKFLNSLNKFVFEILGLAIFCTLIFYSADYLTTANTKTFEMILYCSTKFIWFNMLTIFILASMYLWDFGGQVNKITMLICYMSYWASMQYDIVNLWLYPFTVALFAPAIPNFVLSIPYLVVWKKREKQMLEIALKAFKSGFRPITENSKPLYIENKIQARIAMSSAVLCGSILISTLKLKFYGGISSPLGFIFGYVDQGNLYYGLWWFVMYITSIFFGSLVFLILSIKKRGKRNV